MLPAKVMARVAVEQASTFGWERYIGTTGRVIGMHTFGASAPLKEPQRKSGFEPDDVVMVAKGLLGIVGGGRQGPGPALFSNWHGVLT